MTQVPEDKSMLIFEVSDPSFFCLISFHRVSAFYPYGFGIKVLCFSLGLVKLDPGMGLSTSVPELMSCNSGDNYTSSLGSLTRCSRH